MRQGRSLLVLALIAVLLLSGPTACALLHEERVHARHVQILNISNHTSPRTLTQSSQTDALLARSAAPVDALLAFDVTSRSHIHLALEHLGYLHLRGPPLL